MRPFRRSVLLGVLLLLMHGCTDGNSPLDLAEQRAVVGLVASYGDIETAVGSQQIDSVRVVVLDAESESELGRTVEAVQAGEDSIRVDLELSFDGGIRPTVIITAELLQVDGGTAVVEWSTRSPPVTLESETTVSMPSLGRGPLDNLSVESLAIAAPSGLVVVEGGTLQLSSEVTTDDPDATPTLFWFSLDEAVATVDGQGLVSTVAPGTVAIGVAAGYAADTVEVTVRPTGDVPVNPPPLWIDDFGTPLNQSDDDCDFVEFGFSFTFYGETYTGVWVNSNGNLTFGECNTTYWNANVPDGTRVLVAPIYGDWYPRDTGDVYWNVIGSAGSRTFVATWLTVPEYSNEDGPGTSTFQVQLREGSNTVVLGYNTLTTDGINWTDSDAGESDMEVGISSGTGSFIRSAVGSEIPALQGTNICYAPSGGEYGEVDCAQLGAVTLSARSLGGVPSFDATATPRVDPDRSADPEEQRQQRLRKLEEHGVPPGIRR